MTFQLTDSHKHDLTCAVLATDQYHKDLFEGHDFFSIVDEYVDDSDYEGIYEKEPLLATLKDIIESNLPETEDITGLTEKDVLNVFPDAQEFYSGDMRYCYEVTGLPNITLLTYDFPNCNIYADINGYLMRIGREYRPEHVPSILHQICDILRATHTWFQQEFVPEFVRWEKRRDLLRRMISSQTLNVERFSAFSPQYMVVIEAVDPPARVVLPLNQAEQNIEIIKTLLENSHDGNHRKQ